MTDITIAPRGVALLIGNRQQFKQAVIDALAKGAKCIVGDFSECEYIDAAGVGVMVSIQRLCEKAEARFVVANLSDDMRTLVELSGLVSYFDMRPRASSTPGSEPNG